MNIFFILVTWKFVITPPPVAKEPTLIVIMSREFVAERFFVTRFQHPFSDHLFKDDGEAKTFVIRWLIT